MSNWLEYIRVFWPVVGAMAGFFAVFALLWLRTKFTPIEDHKAVALRVTVLEASSASHGERLKQAETAINQTPTRQELHNDISALAARMKGVEVGIVAIGDQLRTQNSYLHSLVEHGLDGGAKK